MVCLASCAVSGADIEVEDTVNVATAPAVTEPPPELPPAAMASIATPDNLDEWLRLRGATVEALGSTQRLVFDLSRVPDSVKHFRLSGPPRVVVDVHGPHRAARSVNRYIADNPLVERVRVGHYDGRMRLVVDLKTRGPDSYTVREEGTAVVVYLGDLAGEGVEMPKPPNRSDDRSALDDPLYSESSATDEAGSLASLSTDAAIVEEPVGAGGSTEAIPLTPERPKDAFEVAGLPEPTETTSEEIVDDEPSLDDGKSLAEIEAEDRENRAREEEEALARKVRLAKLTPAPKPNRVSTKRYAGKRVSLDFKDADVQNVLRVIADVSGLNIVATEDVSGRVTLHLVDVPWDQALDVVLDANRLKMIREGNVIRISSVDRVREEQEALRAQQDAERQLEPLQVRYVRVNYARADKALLEKVKGVLTDRGSAAFDERTNTIILRDISRGIDDATELIRQLDIQSPQVLIESNIIEAQTDFAQALGIQWGYSKQIGPATGNPTGKNFPGTVGIQGSGLGVGTAPPAAGSAPNSPVPLIADFPVPSNFGPGFGPGSGSALDVALGSISGSDTLSARLTALEQDGKAKIVSRPRVITLNNVPATISSLTILRVKLPSTGTVISTGTGGSAGSASAATEKIETGIILVVTPQVSSDGFVLLNIRAKSSQADFTREVDDVPVEVSREATSNVLIRDSETVVLGGIFRNEASDSETGIPYLRRIPGIGWLFKQVLKNDRREELMIFITPQIVAGYGAELPTAGQLWESRFGG